MIEQPAAELCIQLKKNLMFIQIPRKYEIFYKMMQLYLLQQRKATWCHQKKLHIKREPQMLLWILDDLM